MKDPGKPKTGGYSGEIPEQGSEDICHGDRGEEMGVYSQSGVSAARACLDRQVRGHLCLLYGVTQVTTRKEFLPGLQACCFGNHAVSGLVPWYKRQYGVSGTWDQVWGLPQTSCVTLGK